MNKGDIVRFVDFESNNNTSDSKITRYLAMIQSPPYENQIGIVLDTDIIGKTSLVWFYKLNTRKTWRLSNYYLKIVSRVNNDN